MAHINNLTKVYSVLIKAFRYINLFSILTSIFMAIIVYQSIDEARKVFPKSHDGYYVGYTNDMVYEVNTLYYGLPAAPMYYEIIEGLNIPLGKRGENIDWNVIKTKYWQYNFALGPHNFVVSKQDEYVIPYGNSFIAFPYEASKLYEQVGLEYMPSGAIKYKLHMSSIHGNVIVYDNIDEDKLVIGYDSPFWFAMHQSNLGKLIGWVMIFEMIVWRFA